MSICSLFSKEEQIDILWSVRRVKQKYNELGIPSKKQYYFRELAIQYHLARRIKSQIKELSRLKINSTELTMYSEIADLFSVNRSVVSRYLKSYLEPRDYKYKELLGRREGGSKGGNNGDKTKNFRNTGNS
jgi:DNA invertase Pin-like site-specific DNA recombinase